MRSFDGLTTSACWPVPAWPGGLGGHADAVAQPALGADCIGLQFQAALAARSVGVVKGEELLRPTTRRPEVGQIEVKAQLAQLGCGVVPDGGGRRHEALCGRGVRGGRGLEAAVRVNDIGADP